MKGYQSAPEAFEDNNYLPLERISDIQVKGKNQYLLSFGRVYEYWSPKHEIDFGETFKLTR